MPMTSEIGLPLDYPLRLAGGRLDLIFDIFNLFNEQEALDYDHAAERGGAGVANPDFGKAVVFQSPRQIRLAARSRF